MNKSLILSLFLLLASFVSASAENQDGDPNNNPPAVIVPLTETSLPIMLINTQGQTLYHDEYKLVQIKIVRNKSGMNYADLETYPNQKLNYNGYAKIKYHGNSSFSSSNKPPFTIKLTDEQGNSQKASLLGMGKAKKWILNAPFMDRSCVRDKFVFDIFRPYFDFVPDMEPIELVIDGVYRGIYYVEEKIGLNKNRINADDPLAEETDDDKDGITGGYVVKVDRGDDKFTYNGVSYNNYYTSAYTTYEYKILTYSKKFYAYYNYVEPDIEDMIEGGVGNKSWINNRINAFETAIKNNNFEYVDMTSFAAYMLATEFARNVDGYRLSTYLFKYRDGVDKRFKMTLWDFDRSFGNSDSDKANDTSTWSYDFNSRHRTGEDTYVPFYWSKLLSNSEFMNEAKYLWTLMRKKTITNDNLIEHLHYLSNVLVDSKAQERNDKAHNIWNLGKIKPITSEQAKFKSVAEEISYIEKFIKNRLTTMDNKFLLSYLPGDVNKDNSFTMADVAGIISIINNNAASGIDKNAADANQDGVVNMLDVYLVTDRILGKRL